MFFFDFGVVMEKLTKYIVLTLILISLLLSLQQFYIGLNEVESKGNIYTLWNIAFIVLVAFWCDKDRLGKNWPFEFGYFVYLFWPVVLPYYLFKTRSVDGLVMFIGFVALYLMPNIMWYLGYQYS